MASSPTELQRFLAELGGRRQRLLRLAAPPSDVGPHVTTAAQQDEACWQAELDELIEQLTLADEELRLQQDELESTRRRLAALGAERDELLEGSAALLVLTDDKGLVLRASRATAALVGHPPVRRTPRPIASWFEVADRALVRTLVSQHPVGEPGRASGATVLRADGSTVLVDVTAVGTVDPVSGDPQLRWELSPTRGPATEPLDPAVSPARRPGLAAELTEMTMRLAAVTTVEETLQAVTQEAVRLVPGSHAAVLVGTDKRGARELLATAGTGLEQAAADELTVPLLLPGYAVVELRLRSAQPLAFGTEARWIAELLAVHFRVATGRALHRQNLEQTIESRQQIGEAVGVLVERRRMTSAAAFDELVRQSQALNLKLREVARIVVETGQEPEQITPV